MYIYIYMYIYSDDIMIYVLYDICIIILIYTC